MGIFDWFKREDQVPETKNPPNEIGSKIIERINIEFTQEA